MKLICFITNYIYIYVNYKKHNKPVQSKLFLDSSKNLYLSLFVRLKVWICFFVSCVCPFSFRCNCWNRYLECVLLTLCTLCVVFHWFSLCCSSQYLFSTLAVAHTTCDIWLDLVMVADVSFLSVSHGLISHTPPRRPS